MSFLDLSWYIVIPCMFCTMLLIQNVCHTKDKIIEGREAESQQQTQLLRQCQAECENLSLKIKVSTCVGVVDVLQESQQ